METLIKSVTWGHDINKKHSVVSHVLKIKSIEKLKMKPLKKTTHTGEVIGR